MGVVPITWTDDEVRDVLTLIDLSLEYARAIDGRDWQRVAGFYGPDCAVVLHASGETLAGPQAVVAALQAQTDRVTSMQHLHVNQQFQPDGDRAHGTFYSYDSFVSAGLAGGELFSVGGTYTDAYERGGGEWKVVRREFRQIWGRGNAAVVGGAFTSNT